MSTNQSSQLWLRIFWLIQNPWRFERSCNNEKCFKLDFIHPQNFPDFPSLSSYFFPPEKTNSGFILIWKTVARGIHLSASYLTAPGPTCRGFSSMCRPCREQMRASDQGIHWRGRQPAVLAAVSFTPVLLRVHHPKRREALRPRLVGTPLSPFR
jgi:hypothetical protein